MGDAPTLVTSGLTPYLTIKGAGADAAIAFYQKAFGARLLDRKPADDGKRLMHAHLLVNGCSLMISDDFPDWKGGQAAPADPDLSTCDA